ncbi:hypothetical protein [Pseudonocardia spinosispora]|uniref:hypothetical protein n=1 Tax=Pseudonocardia spinosispora TaxID=103441 RepID=UPI00042868D2|nr:hypothetical protein [Pseudonocardia spinosispora]
MATSRRESRRTALPIEMLSVVPKPRSPLCDSLRRLLPKADTSPNAHLERVCQDLVEVAAWTSQDGCWQEHASFLLCTSDGRWHEVGFSEPAACGLITRLRELPGFDADLLLDLIGSQSARLSVLWKKPSPAPAAR